MIYDKIPLTKYEGVIDPRFHTHASKVIEDPKYRHRVYTLDGIPYNEDQYIVCMVGIDRTTGDAKLIMVLMYDRDPGNVIQAMACIWLVKVNELPTYKLANVFIQYELNGEEDVSTFDDIQEKLTKKILNNP